MLKNLTTVILAAGSGTRMLSSLPKVLHKVAQQPLLEYVIKLAKSCSEEIITVINEELANHELFNKLIRHYKIDTALQSKPLGTADAVKSVIEYVRSEYTLILYADIPFVEESTIKKMWEEKSDLVVLGFEYFEDNQYGRIVVDERNRLIRIIEKKDAKGEEAKITLCNSGILLVRTTILKEFLDKVNNNNNSHEYYLTDLIEFVYKHKNLYKSSLIKVVDYNEIIGINNKSQLACAEGILQEKLRTSLLNKGVIMIAPNTVFLTPTTIIEKDAVIHPFVFFGPNVWIDSDVTVLPFSHLEGVRVQKGASIGPFTRIRPKTEVKENSKIGNFVEVKNTVLGKSTKASHLSYIGDATIGENVNIGAGTIFCNYDGYKKHHSTIGDNSFIGSNSCIISPIQMGEDVLVAAGSIVTHDIPAKHLAIARVEQKNIKKRI
ncbi:MAG: bifunctional UDP-N-acetylglucosamine diphosphorylase/glucosamine-1-phosphate N-acetyltransferase GlmU [Candidatus Midichloria mitochondrii]|nr:bifunctional UDP-N-acetylglucosamine diphosphorylase/glucosamine-1-phosphate N-acetyltransferase GlmU [Candidatus Midichloria mitochondrii]MDJ1288553.1 bifunctional UDP-N-acetylglucosamine diphosphorylase/glucosamine-1-phosphate N-acetyltransferase GlmU [Candidatus Midichloria mitochondrii]MDJ1299419.1 bifunctional UDP-N-acetylglucosamine diphosphorylase/glucosamine-1-phosphate N-acetyltransferase GlmU [Candidatus Midichloria mitochondrii]MDJ1313491.1 bifunctional UDP-N-acetylglucosamine diph